MPELALSTTSMSRIVKYSKGFVSAYWAMSIPAYGLTVHPPLGSTQSVSTVAVVQGIWSVTRRCQARATESLLATISNRTFG